MSPARRRTPSSPQRRPTARPAPAPRRDAEAAWLSIDAGNTNITIGIHNAAGRVLATRRISTDHQRTEDEYALLLRLMIAQDIPGALELRATPTRGPAPAKRAAAIRNRWIGAAICSVVPSLTPLFAKAVQRATDVEPLVLDGTTRMNVENCYRNPSEVGADRLANAAGGMDRYGGPLIIADFGTATTLDVVSEKGEYLGGCILPGLETSAEALFRRTAKLPRVDVQAPPEPIGRTTMESIRSGLFYGAVDAVDGLVDRIRRQLGCTAKVVATGGLSPMIAPHSKTISHADPDLTLHGLWVIWKLNRKR